MSGVGTVLFNLAVRPDNGKVFVSNTEARNQVRFEPVLRGHVVENRITVLDGAVARPVNLNPHIDYRVTPGTAEEIERSLALPMGMAFARDGTRLYVAAFGSAKVAVLDPDALEAGRVTGEQIPVGLGPSGVVLDEARQRLYVMNRIDHTISVVSTATRTQTTAVSVGHDPSPPEVRNGRRFLYDARTSSGHGDAACGSCHVFGDFDSLAWDLGDPYGTLRTATPSSRVS